MTNTLIAVGALLLIIVGLVIYNQQMPEEKSNETNHTTEKISVSETELNSTDPRKTNTENAVVSSNKIIDLSNHNLRNVPGGIFNQTAVEELNLADNFLEGSLPREVRFLENLKVLNLSNNNFTGVPAEIGQLRNLEVLDLSNNKISGLPHELAKLSKLRILKLQGNNYSATDLEVIKNGLSTFLVVETD